MSTRVVLAQRRRGVDCDAVRQLAERCGYNELYADARMLLLTRAADGQLVTLFSASADGDEPYAVSVQQTSRPVFHTSVDFEDLEGVLTSAAPGHSSGPSVSLPASRKRARFPEKTMLGSMELALERLDAERRAVDAARAQHERLLAQVAGATSELAAAAPGPEPLSLSGLFVFEVTVEEALVVRKGPSFGERTSVCVPRGALVACDRRQRVGAHLFVRLADGRGWLFETSQADERCLRELELQFCLRVFEVVATAEEALEHACAHPAAWLGAGAPPPAAAGLDKGDVLATDCSVRHGDRAYFRVRAEAEAACYWLPRSSATRAQVLCERALDHGEFIYQIVRSPRTLTLRRHPDRHSTALSKAVSPAEPMVASCARVLGTAGQRCFLLEHEGQSGWVVELADDVREWAKPPPPISGSAGSRTLVQLGASADSWCFIFQLDDGESPERQIVFWGGGIPGGLAKQINNCSAKGRVVTAFAFGGHADWFCTGQYRDGSGSHSWWHVDSPRFSSELKASSGLRCVSLAPDASGRRILVDGDAGYYAEGVDSAFLRELDKVHARSGKFKRVALLPFDSAYLEHDQGVGWWLSDAVLGHLQVELESGPGSIRGVTACAETGQWIVVYDRRFVMSAGVPSELSRQLASAFKQQNSAIERRSALIGAHARAQARLALAAATFTGEGWSMTRIGPQHAKFDSVCTQFVGCWRKPGRPRVHHVLQIRNPAAVYARFEAVAARVGNVCRRFHGTATASACRGGLDLGAQPCMQPSCAMCNICRVGFSKALAGSSTKFLRFGRGMYFSATSGKSHDYASGSEKQVGGERMRLMFLCKVAVGRAFRAQEDMPQLTEPPSGFSSVVGEAGKALNYDEVVVYADHAAVPSYLIAYSVAA